MTSHEKRLKATPDNAHRGREPGKTTINLDKITLYRGGREVPRRGYCLMEVVSLFVGEPLSDSPECVSPVLRSFGTNLNDRWDDEQRQKLKPFIPLLPGTAGDGQDEARGFLALDWLIRVFTPAWLHLIPALRADANLLAGQGPITTLGEAAEVGTIVHEIAPRASAARAATKASWAFWDSTGDAAEDAAAWASWAAWDALGDAAWAAADEATRAAGDAIWAIGNSVVAPVWDAAWTAAGDAAWASRSSSRDALTLTVDHLQEFALVLFHRLIDPSDA